MIRRLLLIGVPLLLLAAVLAVLLGDVLWPAQAKQPAPSTEITKEAGTATAPLAAPGPADASLSRTNTEPQRTLAQPPIPEGAVWITVLVVDQDTQAPVAEAEVAWLDGMEWQRFGSLPRGEAQRLQSDRERMARMFGWQARTDQQGNARVHLGPWETSVFARKGNRYGSTSFRSNNETPPAGGRVELREDHALAVQVLDSRGVPVAGVPVQISRHAQGGAFLHETGWVPRTDQDGLTRLSHLQEWNWAESNDSRGAQWRVRTKIPGIEDPGLAFDPQAPPAEPLVLTLPPTGSVEAWVTFRGQPLAATGMGINLAGPAEKDDMKAWGQQPDADGKFRFPCLPLGREWVALARPGGTSTVRKEFAGPTIASPYVLLEVPVPDDQVVLSARCLDDGGRPLAQTHVFVEFRTSFATGGTQLETDASGRLLWFTGRARERNRIEHAKFTPQRQQASVHTVVVTNRELTVGINDLGDLVFTAGRLVATGRFVIVGRADNKYAQMYVERLQSEPGGADTWQRVPALTTSNSADGSFEVRGDTLQVRHRLTFPAYDHLPVAPVEFLPGARDLEVRINPGNVLDATVLLPRNLPKGCEAELRPEGAAWPVADQPGRDRYRCEPWPVEGEQNRLQWNPVARGSYTLAFTLPGLREPLLALPGVQVPALAEGDPRLRDIDLRQLVAALTVRVADAEGKPLDPEVETLAFVQPQEEAATWRGFRFVKGELRMPVPVQGLDLLIVHGGRPPKSVRVAPGETGLRLESWPELSIDVPDARALPEGLVVTAYLRAPEPPSVGRYEVHHSSGGRGEFFRAPGSARLHEGRAALKIGPGLHRLVLQLCGADQRRVALTGVFPDEVVSGSVPLEIRVDTAQLQQAIATLQTPAKGK